MPTQDGKISVLIQELKSTLKTEGGKWLFASIVGLLSLFCSQITQSVKMALNNADFRAQQYEEIGIEISQYIFSAELSTEFIGSVSAPKEALFKVEEEYNKEILAIRKKEFVYDAWVRRYWGSSQALKLKSFLNSVREFDKAIHSINDELEKIDNGDEKAINPKRSAEAMAAMKPALDKLRRDGRDFLLSLN